MCAHPEEGRIRTARAAGTSWRALSREFGLPATTIRDHLNLCREPVAARRARRAGPLWAEFWDALRDVLGEFPDAEAALRRRLGALLEGRDGAPLGEPAGVPERREDRRG